MSLRPVFVALLWLALPRAYAAPPSDHAPGVDANTTKIATLIPNMMKVLAARPLLLRVHAPRFTWAQTFPVQSTANLPDAPFASVLEELPVVGAMQRRAAQHFNTTDSSHPNDFAICYRLSRRMGLQVVPGDATPHKSYASRTPTTIVAFGMTIRMDRLK